MDEKFPYEKFERVLDLILAHADQFLDKLEGWLSKQEAMDYLDIRKSTYHRWVAAGILEPRVRPARTNF